MADRPQFPQTDSIQELAKFWDEHDVADFEDQLEKVDEPVFGRPAALRQAAERNDPSGDGPSFYATREIQRSTAATKGSRELATDQRSAAQPEPKRGKPRMKHG